MCRSTKSKYKEWQIIGEETNPNIKYEVDGVYFESPKQISEVLKGEITESEARQYLNSTNPLYRHWKKISNIDITYDEMEQMWDNAIRITLPIIECDGLEFYSLTDASKHFNCSKERIRQKLVSDKFLNFFYI